MASVAEHTVATFRDTFERRDFSRGLEAVWQVVAGLNKYLVETEPWRLVEDESKRSRLATVLWTAVEGLRIATVLLHPVIPEGTQRLWRQLGVGGSLAVYPLNELAWGQIPTGTKIGKHEPIYPRVDKEAAIARMAELEAAIDTTPVSPKGGNA
jgi:methionyl-tRNA synthetase